MPTRKTRGSGTRDVLRETEFTIAENTVGGLRRVEATLILSGLRMPSSARTFLVALLLSPLLSGCGILERAACGEPCSADPIPVEGSREDFTRAQNPQDGVRATQLATCEENADATFTLVSTMGDEVDPDAWATERLLPALAEAGIAATRNAVTCGAPGSSVYNLLDWRELDAVVDLIGELAEEDAVAVELPITVTPEPVFCPSIGCGA